MVFNFTRIQQFIPGICTGLSGLFTFQLAIYMVKILLGREFSIWPDIFLFLPIWFLFLAGVYLLIRFLLGIVIRHWFTEKLEEVKRKVITKAFNDKFDNNFEYPIESDGSLIGDEAVKWVNKELRKRSGSRNQRNFEMNEIDLFREIGDQTSQGRLREQALEIARLTEIEKQFKLSQADGLAQISDENRMLWCSDSDLCLPYEDVYIDDPIYRHLVIEKEIAPIFFHPIVQRLNNVKQLSFSNRSFPTATHTRLSHSLGVCKNAELTLSRIFDRGIYYTEDGPQKFTLSDEERRTHIRKAKIAALLHDLGHGPFGHGLDLYVSAKISESSPDKFYTSKYIQNYLGKTIDQSGFDHKLISKILDKNSRIELESYDLLISSIIDSPLDVDRMDYLLRDAHITGLSIGNVNTLALIDRIVPFEVEIEETGSKGMILTYHSSAVPYIAHLLYARDNMYLNCYEHPAKVSAERMLMKAVQEFDEKHRLTIDELMLLTDDELLRILLRYSEKTSLSYNYAVALLKNIQFVEVYSISPIKRREWEKKNDGKSNLTQSYDINEKENEDIPPKPSEVVENWESRRLSPKIRNLQRPSEWEDEIVEKAGIQDEDRWKVLVTVPPAGMFEPKYDEIRILREYSDGKYVPDKLEKITGYWEGVLKFLAGERLSIRVFVSETLDNNKVEAVRKVAQELFEAS